MRLVWTTTYILFVAVSGIAACGPQVAPLSHQRSAVADSGIIGGADLDNTHDLAFSVAALISQEQGKSSIDVCSATFLTPRVLLTAAHCFKKPKPVTVAAAGTVLSLPEPVIRQYVKMSVDIWGATPEYEVERVLGHENYDTQTYDNDVAVILIRSAPVGVKPLPIVSSMNATRSAWNVWAVGYGQYTSDPELAKTEDGVGRMRWVELTAMFFDPRLLYIKVFMDRGRGFCGGDSGGPALVKTTSGSLGVIGVASAYESGAGKVCNVAGYYTNVVALGSWITNAIREIQTPRTTSPPPMPSM